MKCPKCGYLGFETTERCRHCGYDFSLSLTIDTEASQGLPLRTSGDTGTPLADFELRLPTSTTAVATPPPDDLADVYAPFAPSPERSLPLEPPPAGPPLSVRRATPEVPRRRTPRMIKRDVADVGLELEPPAAPDERTSSANREHVTRTAPALRRVAAGLVDVVILGGISMTVLYLTLAIAGLSMDDWRVLPAVPMAAFLLLINVGYLIVFTVSNGQTIGKMMTGLEVVAVDGDRVAIGAAALRALGALVCVALAGLPYLPVLMSKDRRALHDRLAGTRVITNA